MKNLFFIGLCILLFIGLIGSVNGFNPFNVDLSSSTVPEYEQGSCFSLVQTCSTCSYMNISYVRYPNTSVSDSFVSMIHTGETFRYVNCNTTVLGKYSVLGYGDPNGTKTSWTDSFIIKKRTGMDGNYTFLTYLAIVFFIITGILLYLIKVLDKSFLIGLLLLLGLVIVGLTFSSAFISEMIVYNESMISILWTVFYGACIGVGILFIFLMVILFKSVIDQAPRPKDGRMFTPMEQKKNEYLNKRQTNR